MYIFLAHPSPKEPLKLHNVSGDSWLSGKELKKVIKIDSDKCVVCKMYQKIPQRPIAGLPMATSFQECIEIELKFYKGIILLHLIDHRTRLLSFVKSKEPKVIPNTVFNPWVQILVHLKNS